MIFLYITSCLRDLLSHSTINCWKSLTAKFVYLFFRKKLFYKTKKEYVIKEAHISSIDGKAEDSCSSSLRLRVDDMACQLAPGGYVITCTRDNQRKLL